MIDLHIHTNASDGELTPAELISFAKESGVSTLAITDHDTVAGIDEAMRTGLEKGIKVIPGIEISTAFPGVAGELHLVGLFINYQDQKFRESLVILAEYRKKRNLKMIEKFGELGITINQEELLNHGEKTLSSAGKPDFARVLTAHGVTHCDGEAYGKYLDEKTGIANIPKEHLMITDAIGLIHNAGGLAILAHPFHISPHFNELNTLVGEFVEHGLDGIEVFYNHYSKEQIKNLKRIAKNHGLLQSGGSDFHYRVSSRGSRLGFYGVKKNIPDSLLEEMRRYLPTSAR